MRALTGRLLVAGSGLTGATIARLASDAGYHVRVLERRAEVGGNVADAEHESGIRYGLHGPHYFRTSSEKIWRFVSKYAGWRKFEARVLAWTPDGYRPWPPRRDASWDEATWRLTRPDHPRRHSGAFERAWLSRVPAGVYDEVVRPYTEKQWGVPVDQLDDSLARRVRVGDGGDDRLKTSRWQALPERGYVSFVKNLLRGCEVEARCDYLEWRAATTTYEYDAVVFTGSIDSYYGYDLGRLPYRAQRREHAWHEGADLVLPRVQVNFPSPGVPHVREVEWKHQAPPKERRPGSLVTSETPRDASSEDDREYPMPTRAARLLYEQYARRAERERRVVFAGRLGEYRYLDMDQAVARAAATWEKRVRPMMEGKTYEDFYDLSAGRRGVDGLAAE